jgi:peptidoglycan/LPS O-acetylase OafA/YrhL
MSKSGVARGFIPELDGLRGLAILLVMVHRFWPRSGVGVAADVAGAGWIGVDLFFVISGFLITGILLDTKGDDGYFRNFYARRMLRIFPLYYLFVIGVFIAFSGNPEFREHAGSPAWYLLHLGNIPEGILDNDVPYWLAPVWSLAIEEQFYLTFPLLVYFLDRKKLTVVLVAMVLAAPALRLATTVAWPDHERVQYLFTLCRIDTLAAGCLLAVIVRSVDLQRFRPQAIQIAMVAVPAVVVLAVASGLDRTSPFDRVFGYSLVAVGCTTIVALVLLARDRRVTSVLRWSPIRYLGKLCFGLYLLHRPADTIVNALADRAGIDADLWIMPAKIAVAVALATLSWRLFERPFLKLKDHFASERHPSADRPASQVPAGWFGKALRYIGILIVIALVACRPQAPGDAPDASQGTDARSDAVVADAADVPHDVLDAGADAAPPPDAPPPLPEGVVLYNEGVRHSPITPALVTRLQAIAAASSHDGQVFAKVGDSITAADAFLDCFAGEVDLGAHGNLASTHAHFLAGNAAGTSPFARTSFAAVGGTTAQDASTGSPSPLDRELSAIDPRYAVVLFGTNEIRYGWTFDDFGTHLWALVDATIARGTIPILSTIPANVGYPAADVRIPTANRIVRAIAQGRGVPLVDLHRALEPLPNRGISADGLHPSVSPDGACVLTSSGLEHGYNVRNLITLEALARARKALAGTAPDPAAATRTGNGTASEPFVGALPLVDLGTAQDGVVYQLQLAAATTIDAHVVDRGTVDVELCIRVGASCIATGDAHASATVGPGEVTVIVTPRTAGSAGEFLLVVAQR